MIKRLFDLVFSSVALVVGGPVLLFVAVLIKLDSLGPVFFRGVRVGRRGRPFRIFKFRSMVVNAEMRGGPSAADDDSRITRVGRFLRKHKLDELPQVINVFKGEMSIVGPRPEVPQYVALFTEAERAILSVRPGITDWATLWNHDEGAMLAGNPDPERLYLQKIRPEKIRLQLAYLQRRSFMVDLAIVARTISTLVFRVKPKATHTRDEYGR